MLKVNDPVAQRNHKENADRMCLASYISGLSANVGKMVRIQNPQKLQQALTIALPVTEAERQEKGNEIFFMGSDKPSDPKDRKKVKTEQNFDARAGRNKSHSPAGRAQSGTTLRCYECDGRGHFGRECPTRLKRERGSRKPPEKSNRSGRSARPSAAEEKPAYANRPTGTNETRNKGNE